MWIIHLNPVIILLYGVSVKHILTECGIFRKGKFHISDHRDEPIKLHNQAHTILCTNTPY